MSTAIAIQQSGREHRRSRPSYREPLLACSARARDHAVRHDRNKREVFVRLTHAFAILLLASTLGAVAPAAAQEPWPTRDWTSASPAEVGLDTKVLAAFDADLAAGKYGLVDSMLVIRHGRVVYERSYRHDYDAIDGEQAKKPSGLNALDPGGPYNDFNPWWHPYYRRGDLHTMQSVSKTVTSVVIGVATARHEFPPLDTPVLSFFDAGQGKNVDARKQRMTLRHLLTMTAGLEWHEDLPYDDPKNSCGLMEASFDWVRFAVDQPMSDEPGARFNYNSGATQILAHVFRKATGHDIEEYAARHLFAPLGIERWFWKRSPTGLADTEGGLYLRPRDLRRSVPVPEGWPLGRPGGRRARLGEGLGRPEHHRSGRGPVRVHVVARPPLGRQVGVRRVRIRWPAPDCGAGARPRDGLHRLEHPGKRAQPHGPGRDRARAGRGHCPRGSTR